MKEITFLTFASSACCEIPKLVDNTENLNRYDTLGEGGNLFNQTQLQSFKPISHAEFKSTVRINILTVSDRAFNNIYQDVSGPTIENMLKEYYCNDPTNDLYQCM